MSKKTFTLVQSCVNAAATVAAAIVAYCQPAYTVAIISGIGVVATAINDVCAGFIKAEKKEE